MNEAISVRVNAIIAAVTAHTAADAQYDALLYGEETTIDQLEAARTAKDQAWETAWEVSGHDHGVLIYARELIGKQNQLWQRVEFRMAQEATR